ncbi:YaaR family protein [Thermicanus aegyptius]|uniref:YaaR family protein n=1 Tax=Thermicanus aegyptius TaxID=94009 RepID=UPI000403290D|nr:YaaR family protein [Thermicanus aegyptius]
MKISRGSQKKEITSSFSLRTVRSSNGPAFDDLLKEKEEEQGARRLKSLLAEIEDQGGKLTLTRTLDDLNRYKKLVREFLDEALSQALRVEERVGSNYRGRMKVYRLVEEVDSHLARLTEEILRNQSEGLVLLEEIGEIKGLLINYFV